MITGFNTDIKHGERVYHVQTEDRGEDNPVVESLVYVGGEIIASKKTPYAGHQGKADLKVVQELMEAQHRKVIAAIQRGRFDTVDGAKDDGESGPIPVEGANPLPAAVPGTPAPRADDKTLDQVILDYLASEVTQERLDLTLYSSPEFYLGETAEIRLKAESSLSRRPIIGAAILIKVISTVDKPAILYQGKTAADGACTAVCRLPDYKAGNAALIIQATSEAGSNEIKYLLRSRK